MFIIKNSFIFKISQNLIQQSALSLHIQDISKNLLWVDMLKGIAIIGVFYENWLTYFFHQNLIEETHDLIYQFTRLLNTASGPFVQVFIILSGFGMTLSYLKRRNSFWSWKEWIWRRITKIIFPYYIFVIFSILLGIISSMLFNSVNVKFSLPSLIALLTFTRNFYPPSWIWNPPLWYMPVIIGLYLIFPLLLLILNKWGPVKLLLTSIFITLSTLFIAFELGATGNHASDLFLFWTFQFVIGMLLAYLFVNYPERMRLLIGILPFTFGSLLIFCSWIIRTYILYGKVFNDLITSIGIFLFLLNSILAICKIIPLFFRVLISLSEPSFLMYLIHYPVMMFIIGPVIKGSINPLIVIILGGIYIFMIYYISSILSRPISNLSAKLYAIFVRKTANFWG